MFQAKGKMLQISIKKYPKKNCPLDKAQLWEQRELDYLPNWHQLLHRIWQITSVRL